MTVQAKICGLNEPLTVAAAVEAGAAFIGFNFYPPSPRSVTPARAAALAQAVPPGVVKVGLFVDADDATIAATLATAGLDLLQLHGHETPARVGDVRRRFAMPVMKVLPIATAADVAAADAYLAVADRLMFDAKPSDSPGALPGGNGQSFDWGLLAGRRWPLPWMLAGGLTADNVGVAVAISGAPCVDVSSGVEDRPGVKNPARIRAFLEAVRRL